MTDQQPRQFGPVAQPEVFPEMIRLHRTPGDHRGKPAAGIARTGALSQQQIAHHHDLFILGRGIPCIPGDPHAAGRRKPLHHETGKVGRRKPCPLGHRTVLYGRDREDRSQYVPVEAEIIFNGGVGGVTSG